MGTPPRETRNIPCRANDRESGEYVTDPGREWTRWHCNRCNHEETARGVREGALPREEEHAWH